MNDINQNEYEKYNIITPKINITSSCDISKTYLESKFVTFKVGNISFKQNYTLNEYLKGKYFFTKASEDDVPYDILQTLSLNYRSDLILEVIDRESLYKHVYQETVGLTNQNVDIKTNNIITNIIDSSKNKCFSKTYLESEIICCDYNKFVNNFEEDSHYEILQMKFLEKYDKCVVEIIERDKLYNHLVNELYQEKQKKLKLNR